MQAERVACALKRPWVAVVSPRGPRFGWSGILCGARASRGVIPVEGGTRGGSRLPADSGACRGRGRGVRGRLSPGPLGERVLWGEVLQPLASARSMVELHAGLV